MRREMLLYDLSAMQVSAITGLDFVQSARRNNNHHRPPNPRLHLQFQHDGLEKLLLGVFLRCRRAMYVEGGWQHSETPLLSW
jgi:hypothetical protein